MDELIKMWHYVCIQNKMLRKNLNMKNQLELNALQLNIWMGEQLKDIIKKERQKKTNS